MFCGKWKRAGGRPPNWNAGNAAEMNANEILIIINSGKNLFGDGLMMQ